jgi:HEAT repeat protein
MLRNVSTVLALISTLTCLTLGCEQADPTKPQYWIAKLEMPSPKVAIDKLRDMRSKEAVTPLIGVYEKGKNKSSVIAALIKIGDKKAIPTLVKAIGDNDEGDTAKQAAAALIAWKETKGQGDAMAQIIKNPKARKEVIYAALRVLSHDPVKSAIPSLLRIVKGDPDIQPIALNSLAADSLGKLGVVAAVDSLIEGLWLDDSSAMRRNMNREARMALVRIGPKALPKILNTFNRMNKIVETRAKKLRYSIGGLVEAKTADLLNDLPDVRAVDSLVKALGTWEEMPANIQDNKRRMDNFIRGRIQKVINCASALAAIGDERGVEPMLKLASSTDIALEFRQASVQQLAFLGQPSAVPGLMKLLKEKPEAYHWASHGYRLGVSETVVRILDTNKKKQVKAFTKYLTDNDKMFTKWIDGKKEELADKLAELKSIQTGEPIPKKKKRAKKKKKKAKKEPKQKLNKKQKMRIVRGQIKGVRQDLKEYSRIQKAYGEVKTSFANAKECQADYACWGKQLAGKDIAQRLMAAYRLAHAQGEAKNTAKDILIKFGGDEDLVVRNAVVFGLRRTGNKSVVKQLDQYIAQDLKRGEKKKKYKGAAAYLRLTREALRHR